MIKRIFCFLVVLQPLLFQYSIGLSTISAGDLLLIIISVIIIYRAFYFGIRVNKPMLFLMMYIVSISFVSYVLKNDYQLSTFLTTIRYVFYLLVIALTPFASCEYKYAVNVYRKVALIASAFLVLQVILIYCFNFYLPGVILRFPLIDKSLYDYEAVIRSAQIKRCMAFFSEPAHFATYVIGYLVVSLFGMKKICRQALRESIFISFAIILSTAISGIITMTVIWGIWIYKYLLRQKKVISIVFLIIIACSALAIICSAPPFKLLFEKAAFNRQASGRLSGYTYITKNLGNSLSTALFGNGMMDIASIIYLSGYPRMLHYYGIIGSVIYLYAFARQIKSRQTVGNMLVFAIAFLSIGTEMTFGVLVLPYLLIISCQCDGANAKNNVGLIHDQKSRLYSKRMSTLW